MHKKLRIGFMGTPDFALSALQAIHSAGHNVVCVYTQPPRPKGRGHKTTPSPVHNFADQHDIPVFTPINFKNPDDVATFEHHQLDIAIVAAYGLILPQKILDAPRLGCVNIHASLLPRWRGAAPIQRAIMAGDTQTGICLMQMGAGLDTGPVITQQSCPITPETTATTLHDALAEMGGTMITECLSTISESQTLPPATPQNDAHSTYAKMLSKDDGRINWSHNAEQIDRQIRALNPWPGTWCVNAESRLKIIAALPAHNENTSNSDAGSVLHKNGLIACGNATAIRIVSLQPEGKKPMDFAAALNGGYIKIGDILS